jgi:hypothetical protein
MINIVKNFPKINNILNQQKITFDREQKIYENIKEMKKKEIQSIKEDVLFFEIENRKLDKTLGEFESLIQNIEDTFENKIKASFVNSNSKYQDSITNNTNKFKKLFSSSFEQINDEMRKICRMIENNNSKVESSLMEMAKKNKEFEYEASVNINEIFEKKDCSDVFTNIVKNDMENEDPFKSEQKIDFQDMRNNENVVEINQFQNNEPEQEIERNNINPEPVMDFKNKEESEIENQEMMEKEKPDFENEETLDQTHCPEQATPKVVTSLQKKEVIPSEKSNFDPFKESGDDGNKEIKNEEFKEILDNEMKQENFMDQNTEEVINDPFEESDEKNEENSVKSNEEEMEAKEESKEEMKENQPVKKDEEVNEDLGKSLDAKEEEKEEAASNVVAQETCGEKQIDDKD